MESARQNLKFDWNPQKLLQWRDLNCCCRLSSVKLYYLQNLNPNTKGSPCLLTQNHVRLNFINIYQFLKKYQIFCKYKLYADNYIDRKACYCNLFFRVN